MEKKESSLSAYQGVSRWQASQLGAIAEPGCLTPRSPGQMTVACAQYTQNTLDLSCMCRPSVKQMLSSPSELRWKHEGPCRAQLSLESGCLLKWMRRDAIPL